MSSFFMKNVSYTHIKHIIVFFVGIAAIFTAFFLTQIHSVQADEFDISTATFPRFDIVNEESNPYGMTFNDDGTKMFMIGVLGDDVNEYTLSTAFDITSASFVDSFSVASQELSPADVAFSADGTKMFVIGFAGDDVNEYTLSIAFDVSTASFVDSLSVGTSAPTGIAFNTDGTKMFVVDNSGDDIREFTLSIGFDVSTGSYVDSFDVNTQESDPFGIAFSADGSKMFVIGRSGDDVNEYTLSIAFDVSTASFVDSFGINDQEATPTDVAFNNDGTKMYVMGYTDDEIHEYTLATGFDVSSADPYPSHNIASEELGVTDVAFSADGTKMFIIGETGDDVNEYNVTTAFEVGTASYVDSFSVSSQESNPSSIAFNTDGTKMFILGSTGDDVNEYTLSIGFDVSTASFVDSFSTAAQETVGRGLAFNTDGTKMFLVGTGSDTVQEYTLSIGFDVSTASYVDGFFMSSQDRNPRDLAFNTDGTKMFISGDENDSVYEYTLSIGFDVSTASYVDALDVSDFETNPYGLTFDATGARMYVVGTSADEVLQYSLAAANNAPTVTTISPSQTSPNTVTFSTTVGDADLNTTTLFVEYSTDGSTWVSSSFGSVTVATGTVATSTGQISSIDTFATSSVALSTIEWNAQADIPNTDDMSVYLRVRAYDSIVYSAWTSSSAFAVDTADPTPPSSLTVATLTPSTILLTLPGTTSTDTNFKEYKIFYSTTSPVTAIHSSLTSSTDANLGDSEFNGATTTLLTGLTPNTVYYFNIFAYDTWGNVTSSAIELSTTTYAAVPGAPTVTAVSPNTLNVILDPNGTPSSGSASYSVCLTDDGTTCAAGSSFVVLSNGGELSASELYGTYGAFGDVSGVNIPAFATNTPYRMIVRAKDQLNRVTSYGPASTAVHTFAAQTTAPTVNNPTTSTLDVAVNTATNPASTTYAIYSTTTGEYVNGAGVLVGSPVFQSSSTWDTITVVGRPYNTSYQFVVIARNGDGVDATTSTASPARYTHAQTPSAVVASSTGQTTATLTWSSGANPNTTKFAILETNTGNYVNSSTLALGSASSQWTVTSTWFTTADPLTVTGLTAGTEYCFGVAARNGDNVETATTTASCITTTAAPGGDGDGDGDGDGGNPVFLFNQIPVNLLQPDNDGGSPDVDADTNDSDPTDTDPTDPQDGEADNDISCIVPVNSAYKSPDSPAVWYVSAPMLQSGSSSEDTDDDTDGDTTCTKTPFKSADVFFTYFTSWNDVSVVNQAVLDQIPNDTLGFMPWGPLYDPQYGALVKTINDPTVYLLLNGEKLSFLNEEVFTALYYPWNWIEDVHPDMLDNYTIGPVIDYTTHHPNYSIVKYPENPAVYRLEPADQDNAPDQTPGTQVKRHIPDEDTFNALNFRWDRILIIPNDEAYPDGLPMTVDG